MQSLVQHMGIVMPLDRANVNTDDIIPARFLTGVTRTGFADKLFHNWRYLQDGQPNPHFVLTMPRYQHATVLLARENFGCGSSREHAAWALAEYGFRVIIAPSFGDIFYHNSLNIGLLPVRLPSEEIQVLFTEVEQNAGYTLEVDLAAQQVRTPQGRSISFQIETYRREALLQGLDAIDQTLRQESLIATYEARIPIALSPIITYNEVEMN